MRIRLVVVVPESAWRRAGASRLVSLSFDSRRLPAFCVRQQALRAVMALLAAYAAPGIVRAVFVLVVRVCVGVFAAPAECVVPWRALLRGHGGWRGWSLGCTIPAGLGTRIVWELSVCTVLWLDACVLVGSVCSSPALLMSWWWARRGALRWRPVALAAPLQFGRRVLLPVLLSVLLLVPSVVSASFASSFAPLSFLSAS